jgi:hypothetical protein
MNIKSQTISEKRYNMGSGSREITHTRPYRTDARNLAIIRS